MIDEKEMQRIINKAEKWARREARQLEHNKFVVEHDLACFKCGTRMNDWGGTGTTNGRHWAICVVCVRRRQAA